MTAPNLRFHLELISTSAAARLPYLYIGTDPKAGQSDTQSAFMPTKMKYGFLPIAVAAVAFSCAPAANIAEVSPEELPALEAQVSQRPADGDLLLRYAAALFSAGQCDSATAMATRGNQFSPANAIGPLVRGPCLEQQGRYEDAIAMYARFAAEQPRSRGLSAVRARELLARRAGATQSARDAIAREAELTSQEPDPQVIAVLPLAISGDSSYQPLSRGLAQMIMSDLSLLRTFRLVERLQLGALMEELQLGGSARVDTETAARLGYLVSAGRMVQGLADIPNEQNMRLEGSVVLSDGTVTSPHSVQGPFRNLIQMEKELVIVMAVQLGYRLSEAERQLILENGTRNLTAFLAYSRGLEAQELGNYASAAVHFGDAVQADPSFQEARTRQEASQAAPAVQQSSPGQVTTLAAAPGGGPDDVGPVTDAAAGAVQGALGDLAATHTEKTTESANDVATVASKNATQTTASEPPPPDITPPPGVTTTIRIVFRLP